MKKIVAVLAIAILATVSFTAEAGTKKTQKARKVQTVKEVYVMTPGLVTYTRYVPENVTKFSRAAALNQAKKLGSHIDKMTLIYVNTGEVLVIDPRVYDVHGTMSQAFTSAFYQLEMPVQVLTATPTLMIAKN